MHDRSELWRRIGYYQCMLDIISNDEERKNAEDKIQKYKKMLLERKEVKSLNNILQKGIVKVYMLSGCGEFLVSQGGKIYKFSLKMDGLPPPDTIIEETKQYKNLTALGFSSRKNGRVYDYGNITLSMSKGKIWKIIVNDKLTNYLELEYLDGILVAWRSQDEMFNKTL